MKIVYSETFTERLVRQLQYISLDNPSAAKRLKKELILQIKKIPKNPYIHRKSIYFDNEMIRDLIFKGYTIVFKINTSANQIEVFGLVKFQATP